VSKYSDRSKTTVLTCIQLKDLPPSCHAYTLLALAFLLVFMFTLLYFHMQPPPSLHAFRRSKELGWSIFTLHKLTGLSLLAVGMAIKLAVSTVVEKRQLSPFASRLLGIAVDASMMNLLFMRLCHFAGRHNVIVSKCTYTESCASGGLRWLSLASCLSAL